MASLSQDRTFVSSLLDKYLIRMLSVLVLALTSGLCRAYTCFSCTSESTLSCYQPNFATQEDICDYGCRTIFKNSTTPGENSHVVRGCLGMADFLADFAGSCIHDIDGENTVSCFCSSNYCNGQGVIYNESVSGERCYSCSDAGVNVLNDETNNCVKPTADTTSVWCPIGACILTKTRSGTGFSSVRRGCDEAKDGVIADLTCETTEKNGASSTVCHCSGHLCNSSTKESFHITTILASLGIIVCKPFLK